MADPFIGEIRTFGFTFNPEGWAFCNGGRVPIQQYEALYAIIGDLYGGDNVNYMCLPRLNAQNGTGNFGYAAMGQGLGPGLTDRGIADTPGSETVRLSYEEIPEHTHTVSSYISRASADYTATPSAKAYLSRTFYQYDYVTEPATPVVMSEDTVALAGGSQPHNNMQPFMTINFCICLEGAFPPRP